MDEVLIQHNASSTDYAKQIVSEIVTIVQLMLLMRVSISSPLVLKAFAAYNMETGSNMKDDLENQYRSIVVSSAIFNFWR